jgi:hypothetical protein
VTLDQSQQISLVTAILGADLSIAAILFGVLGFVYAVFASLACPQLPDTPVKEMQIPILPHPLLDPLTKVARWTLLGLGLSVVIAIGCFSWFLCPGNGMLIAISLGLILEVIFLFR